MEQGLGSEAKTGCEKDMGWEFGSENVNKCVEKVCFEFRDSPSTSRLSLLQRGLISEITQGSMHMCDDEVR